jgi:hypothetical protein
MSTALTAPFEGLNIEEVVPMSAEVKGISRASILQGRRRIRFQPQTGTTAAPGSIIQFVLSDSTGLIDVNSMVLSYTSRVLKNPGGGTAETANVCLDDGHPFRRIQVSLNGSLLDDVDNAHRATNMEIYASATPDFYKTEGSFLHYWKFNEALMPAASAMMDVEGHAAVQTLYDASNTALAGTQQMFPVGLISPSLRGKHYLPLRNMGELVLQLTAAQSAEVLCFGTANSAATYDLKDLFLEVDVVVPHPAYASLLDRICQMPNEAGLVIPVETKLVSQGQSISSTGESAVVVSRATNNLRRVDVVLQPTSGLVTNAYPSVSCFGNPYVKYIQWRCGSLYFPSQPANSIGRQVNSTYAAFGEPASVDKTGIFNSKMFTQFTNGGGFAHAVIPTAGGTLDGALVESAASTNAYRADFADVAVFSYCFDNYKGGEQLDMDGISVIGQAGSQLVNIISCEAGTAASPSITPTIALTATKYIHLKDGGLRIVGA